MNEHSLLHFCSAMTSFLNDIRGGSDTFLPLFQSIYALVGSFFFLAVFPVLVSFAGFPP